MSESAVWDCCLRQRMISWNRAKRSWASDGSPPAPAQILGHWSWRMPLKSHLKNCIWNPDTLAHVSIYMYIRRYTAYIMSYTIIPKNSVWKDIPYPWISCGVLRSYIKLLIYRVYLRMKFSDKYIVLYTEYMSVYTFTAIFCPDWDGTYTYIPVRPSKCNEKLLRPICTMLARLHPAGALEFECSAFATETRPIWSRTNKFIIMSASIGIASSCLLFCCSRAISSPGSAR